MVRPGWLKFPLLWWWRSLPLRVVLTVFVASVVVQVLGGFLLMQQATVGVVNAKTEIAQGEARRVVNAAQRQLDGVVQTGGVNPDKVLSDLAAGFAYNGAGSEQYDVIIRASGRTITAGQVSADSIPADLSVKVEQGTELLITPTRVDYTDGTASVPGVAAGSTLNLQGTDRYQIYLVFPMNQEVKTLDLLRYAVISTGIILVILLTFIAALVSRQVVTPVRAAARTAESIASGNLADRMPIRGQDDLAKLAKSMNYMASELEKQITTLEELSAVQQRFVSDVSHELRTPLTTVRMAAEVLYEAREDFDPVSARSAELMQTELDRFEALLTDLLEISRFDAGAAVLSADVVDLRDVVASVVEANALLARSHGVTITVHAGAEAKAEVDARRIERILRNLVVNAIEHSEGRPIEILIASDQLAVAVAVRDHGVGFEASQAKQVFHRFWRADPARARMVGGSGLGLAIAMEDANLHGGWLTAWGRPGLGAQFRLTLARRLGMVLRTSPLPLVPRDLVAVGAPALESATTGDPAGPSGPAAELPVPATPAAPAEHEVDDEPVQRPEPADSAAVPR